jgi:putative ABC transport system permease protein
VGVVICYQVIYADISDHMKEFGTLKAMGYQTGFFIKLVLTQALYLSLLAFGAGVFVSWGMYAAIGASTGLTMRMSWADALQVLLATMLMCGTSGLLAARKLRAADPAELFG